MSVSRLAVIHKDVHIGVGVTIEPFTIIKKGTVIEDGARISSCVRIEEHCFIGENTFIGHGVVMRPGTLICHDCIVGHLTVFEGGSKINYGTLIHAQCHITKGVTIGKNVFIAPMFVGANDEKMCHKRECLDFKPNGFTIGDGARIAIGVNVLPGISIGSNTMLGAGAVVTKDIPDNTIAWGAPAKVRGEVRKDERI